MEGGGLKFERLPISGGAELNTMLLGGNAQFAIAPAADMTGLAMAGKFKFLAFANEERNKDFPDIPTFKELGYPSIVLSTFYAIATQKNVPDDVLKILRDALAKAWEQGETKTLLKGLGHTPFYRNAEDLGTYIESQVDLYRRIAEKANIKITQ
jgi:tripartite-type tricarboxylate transporter receptor subunit TctC